MSNSIVRRLFRRSPVAFVAGALLAALLGGLAAVGVSGCSSSPAPAASSTAPPPAVSAKVPESSPVQPSATPLPTPVSGQATLTPATVGKLKVGDTAYVRVSALWFDFERHAWLASDYPITPAPYGTSNMKIRREAKGFQVWAFSGMRYYPGAAPVAGSSVPVTRLDYV